MQPQFFVQNNGQEVPQADFNLLGENAGLADDRALAGLLRLAPYISGSPAKAVLPSSVAAASGGIASIILPSLGNGSVLILPFVGIVGSRADSFTNTPQKNWQDIRAALFSAAANATVGVFQPIASNASGQPRWDLVYATLAVDSNDTNVTRFVKDPTSLVVAPQSLPVTKSTKVTIIVLQGTPAASPTQPALPADAGSNYNIPIAYVRVPNGFNGTSSTSSHDIQEIAPIVTLHAAMGVAGIAPANSCYDPTSTHLATRSPWTASGNRPRAYLPPSMTGGITRIFPIQRFDAPNSAISGDVLDASIDWRRRLFKWTCQVVSGGRFVWDPTVVVGLQVPSGNSPGLDASNTLYGMGQSYIIDIAALPGAAAARFVALIGGVGSTITKYQSASLNVANRVGLYVDDATGQMKFYQNGPDSGNCYIFWVEATSQFNNT